jgi:hypothetical protein
MKSSAIKIAEISEDLTNLPDKKLDQVKDFISFLSSKLKYSKKPIPSRRINDIVHGKRKVTADTAIRLGRYF